jgi:hypothetical protein
MGSWQPGFDPVRVEPKPNPDRPAAYLEQVNLQEFRLNSCYFRSELDRNQVNLSSVAFLPLLDRL